MTDRRTSASVLTTITASLTLGMEPGPSFPHPPADCCPPCSWAEAHSPHRCLRCHCCCQASGPQALLPPRPFCPPPLPHSHLAPLWPVSPAAEWACPWEVPGPGLR
eukprot:1162113-Pelagomonas_calceolata.AAC.19